MSAALKPGEVLLLENVRFYPEEKESPCYRTQQPMREQRQQKLKWKANKKELARKLSTYAEVYVMRHSEQHTGHMEQQP